MYELIQGDCIEVMKRLEAGSVQTCVTSPPYYGLRDYGNEGQIGLEPTPEAYVSKLVEVFREVKRVLRDDGTLWVNLGDSYASSSKGSGGPSDKQLSNAGSRYESRKFHHGVKEKDLIGIPWLVAFALRADGWYLRSDIIWHKPNPMPESVTDRPTKAHEYIFLLSKSAQYFYDADAIRENNSESTLFQHAGKKASTYKDSRVLAGMHGQGKTTQLGKNGEARRLDGRNKRSVWTVTTKPYSGAHFATFPPDLIEPCILAGTSNYGCCAKCGAGWERMVERNNVDQKANEVIKHNGVPGLKTGTSHDRVRSLSGSTYQYVRGATLGWQPTCTCNADIVPCTVLDPFNGSGTTGAVSLKHGRNYIGIDLNADYLELAHKRITESQPMLAGIL